MAAHESLVALCRCWIADAPVHVAVMRASGFSGSHVSLVERHDTGERFVLKCFHEAATREHARFVHELARHLRGEGVTQVPEVMRSSHGDTIVVDAEGRLWELCRFMSGVAVASPSPVQAVAAASHVARLHVAAARCPAYRPQGGASRGIVERIARARTLLVHPWHARLAVWSRAARQTMDAQFGAGLEARAYAAVDAFAACGGDGFLRRLAGATPPTCVLQPVLRDVWHEHILFDAGGDDVAAIIDLHAAAIDTPATDLARLTGSWGGSVGPGLLSLFDRWPEAFNAYRAVRPIPQVESHLIPILHAGTVLFGLDNWFRWTFEERRAFPDVAGLFARIDSLLEAMPAAVTTAWCRSGLVD